MDRIWDARSVRPGWLAVAAVLSGVAATWGWATGDAPSDAAVLIARYTARVSLALFVVCYVLGPARRDWLAAFVVAHLLHFTAMVGLFAVSEHRQPALAMALGCLAYAAPAVALATPRARWHRWALDYVWLSFAITYYHRLFDFPDRRQAGVVAFALLVAALAFRIMAARRRG